MVMAGAAWPCYAGAIASTSGDAVSHDELVAAAVAPKSEILAVPGPDALSRSRQQDEPRYEVGVQVRVDAAIDLGPASALVGGPPAEVAGGAIRFDPSGFVWSAVVRSPGAMSLRLGFENLAMPPGAALYLYDEAGTVAGPYTGPPPSGRRAFFAPTLPGEATFLQIRYAGPDTAGTLAAIRFTLTEVAHLDERFLLGRAASPGPVPRAHCENLNEVCVENAECDLHDPALDPVVQGLQNATAEMLFQSGSSWYLCTGGLIESLDGTTGHLLTANHCISTASEAASLETYFHFTTPCPPGGGPTTTCDFADATNSAPPTVFGATIVDTSAVTDFTLLRLDGTPPPGTTHLPFSTVPVADFDGAPLYRVSHPSGAPQAYSEHAVDASYSLCGPPGDFIYSRDVLGATEGGSSGAPVVNAGGEIVGQLYGGCGTDLNDECDTVNNRTYDGAFAATWQRSPLVRNALAQEPLPVVVQLAQWTGISRSRNQSWVGSFANDVPYDNLSFVLAGSNGDGDLYVKFGSPPTLSDWDCRPYLVGTNETCTFDPAQAGTYYVMVRAYQAFSNATLTITTAESGACADADGDGVCDADDVCPGSDDAADGDGDGIPDGCDACPAEPSPASNTQIRARFGDGAGDDKLAIKAEWPADLFAADPTVTGLEVRVRGHDGQTVHEGLLPGAGWEDRKGTGIKFVFRDRDGIHPSANGFVAGVIKLQATKNLAKITLKTKGVDVPEAQGQASMSASFLFGTDPLVDACLGSPDVRCEAKPGAMRCKE
jgi:hypothetical protein